MNAPVFKVGDIGIHVERYGGNGRHQIRVSTIVRETKSQWVDDVGTRWRKRDGAMIPQYSEGHRYLMSVTEWNYFCMRKP